MNTSWILFMHRALSPLVLGLFLFGCSEHLTFREMPLGLKPDTELTSQNGQREKLVSQLGRVSLLFFGFTRCPDFCPTTLHRLQSAIGDDADLKARLMLLFISVDAANDKPADLARYLANFPYARGFTGTADEIHRVEKMFGAYSKEENGTISHSLYLYLLNKQGKVIYLIRYDDSVEKIRRVLQQAAKL